MISETLTAAEAALSIFHPHLKDGGYQAPAIACISDVLSQKEIAPNPQTIAVKMVRGTNCDRR